jgi:hypothetical protein
MGIKTKVTTIVLISSLGFLFTGCQLSPNSQGLNSGGTGGGIFGGVNSSVLGGVTTAGGSGPAGVITQTDTQALQNVVSAQQTVKPASDIDSAISQQLIAEMNDALKKEQSGQDVSALKYQLLGQALQQCTQKTNQYIPIPGQPLMGEWKGNNAGCHLVGTFSVNGPGNQQVYGVSGGINGQLAAYPDGRFELRSAALNGNGKDSGYQNQDLSGTGTLTGTVTSNNGKYSTTSPCTVEVSLANSRNPIPANYQNAVKVMGACFRKAFALVGMDAVFNKMDPALAQALMQQMLK